MGELDIFEDSEKFPSLIKTATAYNKENIYLDIEEKVFGKTIK